MEMMAAAVPRSSRPFFSRRFLLPDAPDAGQHRVRDFCSGDRKRIGGSGPQAADTPREKCCRFDGDASGRRIYAYVGNDPLNLTDPTGRFGWVGLAIGAGAGFAAGYETGGLKGAVLGGIVGGGVGIFAPWVSGEVGGFVGGLTGSATAGAIASAGTFSALGAAAGAGATVVTNLATGQPTFDDVGNGALIGGAAPLLSGEAALVGLGEAGAATYGLSGLADWASLQTGVFGALGTAADAGVNQSGVFAPGTAAASPSGPQCH